LIEEHFLPKDRDFKEWKKNDKNNQQKFAKSMAASVKSWQPIGYLNIFV
jgi:hypothetical protein